MSNRTFYVTTPIYYVTAKPHLGSLYSTILADVMARWNKLLGNEVFFLTGTDEHGQKIAQAAEQAGQDPKKFVDSFIPAYMDTWNAYHIAYTYFIRTTDHTHKQAVQKWINILLEKGDIYQSFYKGWYCTPCETFLTETDVAAQERDIPNCISCTRPTSYVSEEAYFFRLSAYQERLLQFYRDHPNFFVPKERAQEIINFVSAGLKDFSISRTTIEWGIPFAHDPKHVTYVWADALNNYITAIGWGQPGKEAECAKWWPANVQVIGKDIIRFHAVYWPAFLMAIGLEMPKQLLVHGWILVNKQKMSKSFGNVIDPMVLVERYGADAVRYYLTRQIPVTHDSNFSIEDLEQHITADLAHDLGNLLHRMTHVALQYDVVQIDYPQAWSSTACEMRDACWNMIQEYKQYMQEHMFHLALARLWKYIAQVNGYFHSQEPWKLVKKDRAAFVEVLSVTCHSLRAIAIVAWPVMPVKMEQLLATLGTPLPKSCTIAELENDVWRTTFMVHKTEPLFEKPILTEGEQSVSAELAYIDITDFQKMIVAIGTILDCTIVEKSDKLYTLQVDCGQYGTRQILSGIRKHFTPEQLIGKQAAVLVNLKPRTMMGLCSEGMILTAEDAQGSFQLVTATHAVPNGTTLR